MLWLTNLLKEIENKSGIKPIAFSNKTTYTPPVITYSIYPTSNDGIKEQWRIQLRIADYSLENIMNIYNRIKPILTIGDETNSEGCLVAVNGGGTLQDAETGVIELLIYIDTQNRS